MVVMAIGSTLVLPIFAWMFISPLLRLFKRLKDRNWQTPGRPASRR